MILFDISSAFHMCTHRIAKTFSKGEKIDLKDYRQEFHKGMLWVLDTHQNMFKSYGDPVICMDDKSKPSWRKTEYPKYKSQRKKFREGQTLFDYSDAYVLFDEFLNAIKDHSGIKNIGVPEAEADDIILVLGEFLSKNRQRVMILSPDKDFIQLQVNPLVEQYSWFTKKLIVPEDKGSMQDWLLEHICLGDQVDAVPRIVDFQNFKPGVKEYLESKGIYDDPWTFSNTDYDLEEFERFGGLFESQSFGPSKLKKLISDHGSLENLLESNEIIKKNYERNKKLVMLEGIPNNLRDQILKEFQVNPSSNLEAFTDSLGLELKDLPEFMKNKYTNNFDW